MLQFSAIFLSASIAAPVPRIPADEWLGEQVFPKTRNLPLMDEQGRTIGSWSVTAGKVLWANNEKVLLRHNQHPGPSTGYALKSDLVRLDDAPAYYAGLIKENARDMWAWQNKAVAWTLKEQYDRAIEDLTEAIRLDSGPYMYNSRGNVYLAKKDYDKAIEDYSEALRLNPGMIVAFSNRGAAWLNKDEYDKAIKDLDESIRLDPRYARGYLNRGNAWKKKKEYDKAISDFDEAIKLEPKNPATLANRGMTWAYKKDYEKADKDFDEAIRIDPKNVLVFYNKACALALQGKTDRAIDNLRRSFEFGYKNFEHITKDSDLDSIRDEAGYKELMKKYAP